VSNLFSDTELSKNISSLFTNQFSADHVDQEQDYFKASRFIDITTTSQLS
jgi:hypothetical protein